MAKQDSYTSAEFRAAIKNKSIAVGEKKGDKEKQHMESVISRIAPIWVAEYKFCEDRKFKFDWALPTSGRKIAIEYEGLMSEKSGHTTITGYTSNCEKYNLACILGWRVLRYTALNYKDLERDLKAILD